MRRAFQIAVLFSLAGPLFLYWVGFAQMWMLSDAFLLKYPGLMQEGCLEIAKNGTCARWAGDSYS